ncbi:MAG: glycoside hydrolase domain-containing protein [Thermoguttaceae bacterium]|jgi:hypothetical protein
MILTLLDGKFQSAGAATRGLRATCSPIAALAMFGCAMAALASPPPVLHLDFEHGLLPAAGPKKAGEWSGKTPPQFDPHGLTGKGLLVTDVTQGKITLPAPPGTRDHGTLLLWSRGLENWDIWGRGNNRHLWPGATLIEAHGEEGGLLIYKWSWYDSIACLLMPSDGQGNRSLGEWPNFDQYQWTQIGISWQGEPKGVKRLRFYLNGEAIRETGGQFPFDVFALTADASKGSRRMYDDLKIWDRAIPASEIKRMFRQDAQIVNQPVVTIPRLAAAPTIDGTIGPGEWDCAARITGLIESQTGEVAADQSAMYLGFDANYLYVAMTGDMPPYARDNPALVYEKFLRAEGRGRTASLDGDDTVEMMFAPGYWRTADHRTAGPWREYSLLTNAAGAYTACSYGSDGKDPAWNPYGRFASHAGRDGWQFEAAIPLAAFGGPAPAPGERWGLQLGRIWRQLKNQHDVWAWGRRERPAPDKARMYPGKLGGPPVPFQPDPTCALHSQPNPDSPLSSLGLMRFAGDDTPLVRVDRLGALTHNEIDFHATISNPAAKEQKVQVKLGTDTEPSLVDRTITLPAHGRVEIDKRHVITDYATSRLSFEVLDAAQATIHRTSVPLFIEQRFGMRFISYPNYERFLVELDLGTLSGTPLDTLRIDLQMRDAAGKEVLQKDEKTVSALLTRLNGSTAGIAPGAYTLSAVVRSTGKVLAREEQTVKLAPKAAWWNNRYGYDDVDQDRVPYPWTDMKVEGETVQVWGRSYRFGKGLLPEQISTLGAPMLRSPVRVVMKTADGQTLDSSTATAQPKWARTNKTRVEGTRTLETAAFSLSNAFWAEYDGLVWCRLTVVPKRPVTVDSLVVEVPLNKVFSDVTNQGWMGNGDGGIQVFQEDNVFSTNTKTPVRVDNENGQFTWRMTLFDKPTELAAPRTITLGMIATPVRPKIWRTPMFDSRSVEGGGPWFPGGLEFMPAADPGIDYYSGASGGRLYVHTEFKITPSVTTDVEGTTDWDRYGYEWATDSDYRYSGSGRVPVDVTSKSFRDYFAWRFWRYQQKYGFAGLYFDNPQDASLDTRDVVKRLYNITLQYRQGFVWPIQFGGAKNGTLDMRYMGFWQYHWDGENLNSVLQPGDTYLGILNPRVFRAEYMGHNFGWPARLLGQGRVRPGAVQSHGGPEAVYDHVSGLALLHDTAIPRMMPESVLPGGSAMNQVEKRLFDAIDRHGYWHWAYQFLPYWRQHIVTLPREGMYASFCLGRPSELLDCTGDGIDAYFDRQQPRALPGVIRNVNRWKVEEARAELMAMKPKAFVIVYNDTAWEGTLRLRVDWDKLGLGKPESLKATNAVHSTGFRVENANGAKGEMIEKAVFFSRPQEYAKIEQGELVMPMTKFNYRMIVIEHP